MLAKRQSSQRGARQHINDGLIWLCAIFALALFLLPLYWVIQMSLKTNVQISVFPPQFSFTPTWENYRYIFSDAQPYTRYLFNSIVIALGVMFTSVSIGALAGYTLSRQRSRTTETFLLAILVARAVPTVVIAIPLYLLFRELDLLGSLTAIVLGHLSFILPMSVWIVKTFFDEIPVEIEEAARVDGATTWHTLYRIVLPLSLPGLYSAGILSMIFSWNEFLLALVLTRSGSRPMSVAVASFAGSVTLDWGRMSAAAVLAILPMIVFVFTMQRYLIRGLTGGAVKG